MKIRRRPPADFGASTEAAPAIPVGETSPDLELDTLAEPAPAPPLSPPPIIQPVAAAASRTPARRPETVETTPEATVGAAKVIPTPAGWPIWLTALVVSVLWAVAPIAFAVGYRRGVAPLTQDSFALIVFGLLAIGPAVFVWGAAYMIRQGQKLAAETRRAKAMAEEMIAPAIAAAARTGHVVQAVREEIVSASQAADEARETLLALRQALAEEAARLADTTQASVRTATDLAATLGREREEMGGLSQTLDAQATKLVDAVSAQARMVADAARSAEDQLLGAEAALARSLEGQAAKVAETVTEQARRVAEAADAATGQLTEAEAQLSQRLEGQAAKVAETINSQARMVTEAAEVAESQLREAEAALSARAADLVAAAGEAGDAARTAGEDLVRHIARLESAGVGVSEQVKAVEGGLASQRTALMGLAQALKGDHAQFAEQAEAHAATLGDFISQARLSAAEMNDRAVKGGEALKSLMADAATQFRDLAETARAEREEFGQSTLQALEAVSGAAAQERANLEAQTRASIDALHKAADETREAAARHAATAREQVDHLSEAAFEAGQRANQVFEARLEEARALVEASSKMVEDAGAATARKLDEGAAAARAAMQELAAMLGDVESRTSRLPGAAREQAEEVRATVEQGIDELMAAARRTAEEAQAIDTAFQERVRRNFETLSEAVRLMGTVAAAPPAMAASPAPSLPPQAATPPPVRVRRAAAPEPAPPRAPRAPIEAAEEPDLELEDLVEPAPRKAAPPEPEPEPKPEPKPAAEAKPAAAPLAARLGLRPRLKLTPTASDAEFSQVFEAAGGPPVVEPKAEGDGGEGGWSWKDLLSSIDGSGGDAGKLEEILAREVAEMGVDPAKLLPKARIDEIAAAVQVGDLDGARQVVKRLAPAATRRITRRLSTDDAIRGQVISFVRRYHALVDDAGVRDPEGFLMAEVLGGDAGRLYLLLDAAAEDMV